MHIHVYQKGSAFIKQKAVHAHAHTHIYPIYKTNLKAHACRSFGVKSKKTVPHISQISMSEMTEHEGKRL